MNSRTIKLVIAAKGGLLLAAVAAFLSLSRGHSTAKAVAGKGDEIVTKGNDPGGVPSVPEGPLSTSQAVQIRNELLFLKKDVEGRIGALAQAKHAYERSKADVELKLKKIEEERRLLEESLQREKSAKEERLQESIEFFAKMEPRKSASVLEGMDRDLVILVLRKLPPRLVTKILENMTPAKATQFMEYYTKIRSGREYALMKELGLCAPEGQDAASFWERIPAEKAAPSMAMAESSPAPASKGATSESGATPAVTPSVTPTAVGSAAPTQTTPLATPATAAATAAIPAVSPSPVASPK